MNHRYSPMVKVLALAMVLTIFIFAIGCTTAPENSSDKEPIETSSEATSVISGESPSATEPSSFPSQSTSSIQKGSVATNGTQKTIGTTAQTRSTAESTTTSKKPVATTTTRKQWGDVTNGYVQPQFFISTFKALPHSTGASLDTYRKIVRLNKEAGINLIENAIMSRQEGLQAFQACEAEGVRFLAQNITADKGYSGMGGNLPAYTEDTIKFVVDELKNYKYLEGYYTWDEVTRNDFNKCKTLNSLFKKYDRPSLTFSLVLPSYGQYNWTAPDGNWRNAIYAQYVNEYVAAVNPDVLSFDYYPFQMHGGPNANLTNCTMWRDMGLMRQKSLETGKPFWFYFQGYSMAGDSYEFTGEMLSVQMYCALAYGVKCLSYFSTISCVADPNGNKYASFDTVKALNHRVQNIGNLLFKQDSEELYHFGIKKANQELYYLDKVENSSILKSAPDNTIVGIFGNGGAKKYILVASKDYKNALAGSLSLKKSMKISRFDPEKNTISQVSASANNVSLNIPAGGCAVFVVE